MAQYEMGFRDYWRILRKRKLVIILMCIGAGGLTYLLSQHVFRRPPRFTATCELSVQLVEFPTYPKFRRVSAAQEAKVAKSEMLLHKMLWAAEHFPFYAAAGCHPLQGSTESRKSLLEALRGLGLPPDTRVAGTREFAYLFANQDSNRWAAKILAAAKAQEKAVASARGKEDPLERAASLEKFRPDGFLHNDKKIRERIISQLQNRTTIEWDNITSTFEIEVETTGRGFSKEDERLAGEAAVHLAETLGAVYQAPTEWESRRVGRKERGRVDAEISELREQRKSLEEDRRKKQEKIEANTAGGEYQEARLTWRSAADQLSALEGYLDTLNQYIDDRAQIKAGAADEKTCPPIPTPAHIDDGNIRALYKTSILIEQDKNNKLEFCKPDSHVIAALDQKIGRTAAQLRKILQGAIENEKSRVAAARKRFEKAKEELPIELRAEVSSLDQKIGDLAADIAKRNSDRSRLSLLQEQGVRADIIGRPGMWEEADRASAAAKTLAGAFIGLVLGVVIAVLWETLDLTIGTIEEVESFLKTRVLGVVPHIEVDRLAAEIRERYAESEAGSTDAELQQRAMLVTLYDPKSVSAEAFRHIRTALDFAPEQHKRQAAPGGEVILTTSATLYEGKTIVAVNLAMVMAQNNKRVCLVECDLRRPQLHHILGIDRTPGLHDVFIGKMDWRQAKRSLSDLLLGKIGMKAAVGTSGLENLTVLTCGTVPPNPVELLNSAETQRLFAELREEYDVVIVDSPPILPVADAAAISPFVDGVILVYRAGSAPRSVLGRANTELEAVNTRLFGVVLNALRPTAGELSATYPYKGYARKAYALPQGTTSPGAAGEEQRVIPPSIPKTEGAPDAAPPVARAGESAEDQAIRKADRFLSKGKVEQALQIAYDAAQSIPESMSVRLLLARACAAAGRTEEAQAELIRVLDIDPRNQEALEQLAQMALDGGLEREALRWYEEMLDFDPENAKARQRADEIRARVGDSGPQTV